MKPRIYNWLVVKAPRLLRLVLSFLVLIFHDDRQRSDSAVCMMLRVLCIHTHTHVAHLRVWLQGQPKADT